MPKRRNEEKSVELKSCPFCGGMAEIAFSGSCYSGGYIVARCIVCKASTSGAYYKGEPIKDIPLEKTKGGYIAAERWNRRIENDR